MVFVVFVVICVRFQWNQMKLIGHRGVGAEKYAQATPNLTRRTHIQENTVLSFVTASKSGADFIEFDVQVHDMANRVLFAFSCWFQVTRDGHPVIHHDVAVDLGGVRIPVVSLTLQEFLVIRDANHSSQQPHVASALPDEGSSRHRNRSLSPRSRGKSDEGLLFARFEMKSGLSFCCLRICYSGQPWLSLINFRH
jgi:glycerophosphoryl diester phosphodiesterase